MFVSHDREKLTNALIYFLGSTNHAHTLKLFKLLNFSDFEHFRQTGRTITGLEYSARPMGPVPMKLHREILRGPGEDLKRAIAIEDRSLPIKDEPINTISRQAYRAASPVMKRETLRGSDDLTRAFDELTDNLTDKSLLRVFKPKVPFDPTYFSKRELKIMAVVAEIFRDAKASDMTEFSHIKGLPWREVFDGGKGDGKNIPPILSLDSEALMKDAPTIAREELEDRMELLRDTS
jgi:hypothetical protein